ncbi:MAG: clpB, partial [Patescibacteria group bacterium]|nr:clpB [Patescibacteria group bacterium]
MAVICDICRIRPATARVSFVKDGAAKTIDVCAHDYADLQKQAPFGALLPNETFNAPTANASESQDITDLFSAPAQHVLQKTAGYATEWGSRSMRPEHMLMALCDTEVVQGVFKQFKIETEDIKGYIEANVEHLDASPTFATLSPELSNSLGYSVAISRELGHQYIGPEHLLVSLMQDDGMAGDLLHKYGLTPESLRQQVLRVVGDGLPDGETKPTSKTPHLDKYSRDLSALAAEKKLDPVIGRSEEIQTTMEILSRRTKNNPVLIGEPGVGKTAIVEGLAQRIAEGEAPDSLKDKRVVEIIMNSIVAGTRYRGEFEERMKAVLDEITKNKDELLVFIDELHTVVGAGSGEGGLDAANVIKPSLARGELHLIGATTLNEYQKHIEKDSALERRFQPVVVKEPSVEQSVQIMMGIRPKYEEHHKVSISDAVIQSAADLSDRYITSRFLPDKAIDLVDQAAAKVRIAKKTEVTPEHIAQVVSSITGIPVTELTQEEKAKLL